MHGSVDIASQQIIPTMTHHKNYILHNLILVDESASMQKMRSTVVQSINDTIATIQNHHSTDCTTGQQQKISLFSFNGLGTKMHRYNEYADQTTPYSIQEYKPNSTTPLLDCIGSSIGMLRSVQLKYDERVMVTIISDGVENGSKKYCINAVRRLIDCVKGQGWIFNYIGAHEGVANFCRTLNITNYYQLKENAMEKPETGRNMLSVLARKSYYNCSQQLVRA
jgi:hypothetical protein